MTWFILTVMPVVVTLLTMIYNWRIAYGKLDWLTYAIGASFFSIFIVIEGTLALQSPDQRMVALFMLPNFWGVIMSIKGVVRVRDSKE